MAREGKSVNVVVAKLPLVEILRTVNRDRRCSRYMVNGYT
jgi:hypothetical protein